MLIFNKNKCIINLLLGLFPLTTNAQDLKTAKDYYVQKKYIQAKESIDNHLIEGAYLDAESWFWKAKIYHAIGISPAYSMLVAAADEEALESIKKANKLDKSKIINLLREDNFSFINDLYRSYAIQGVAFFNAAAETKNTGTYISALDKFKKGIQAGRYFVQQGWMPDRFDTLLYYNAAQSAINAQKEDDALLFCPEIAKKGIKSVKNHPESDFLNIYQWLVAYFANKADYQNQLAYAMVGCRLYPGEYYFVANAINAGRSLKAVPQLMQVYQDAQKRFPNVQEALLFGFCTDLSQVLYSSSKLTKADEAYRTKAQLQLEKVLKAYVSQYPDSSKIYLLTGKCYYNKAVYLQKMGAKSKTVLQTLMQASSSLEQLAVKFPDNAKEGIALLISIYQAMGKPKEAAQWQQRLKGM